MALKEAMAQEEVVVEIEEVSPEKVKTAQRTEQFLGQVQRWHH